MPIHVVTCPECDQSYVANHEPKMGQYACPRCGHEWEVKRIIRGSS